MLSKIFDEIPLNTREHCLSENELEIVHWFKVGSPGAGALRALSGLTSPFTVHLRSHNHDHPAHLSRLITWSCLLSCLVIRLVINTPVCPLQFSIKASSPPAPGTPLLSFFLIYLPWREVRDQEGDTSEKTWCIAQRVQDFSWMSFGASTSAIFYITLCVHHIVPTFHWYTGLCWLL